MANRIVITTNGKKDVGYSCPFWTTDGCSIKKIDCSYGLTEINVPKECPLRDNPVETHTVVETEFFNVKE